MPKLSEAPSHIQVLRASHLMASLSEEHLLGIAGDSKLAHAERGELIWLNGTETNFFGVVGTGFVKMMRSTPTGQDVTTELMGPGQVFGLLGVIDGSGCPQSAQAVCATWYLQVPKARFLEVYDQNLILKEKLLKRTTHRLRNSYAMFARMSAGKVEQRIASILLILAESYGIEQGAEVLIDVPLTRQDISEMAGTTVETTIRILSKWQKSGLVATQKHRIILQKPELLAEMV